jgi:hypothetical protein
MMVLPKKRSSSFLTRLNSQLFCFQGDDFSHCPRCFYLEMEVASHAPGRVAMVGEAVKSGIFFTFEGISE